MGMGLVDIEAGGKPRRIDRLSAQRLQFHVMILCNRSVTGSFEPCRRVASA